MEALTAVGLIVTVLGLILVWAQNNRLSSQMKLIIRRSDSIQERLAAVEEDRRRNELEPQVSIEHLNRPSQRLVVRNDGPLDYDEVVVEIADREVVPTMLRGLREDGCWTASIGSTRRGESRDVPLVVSTSGRGGEVRLRVTCESGSSEWTTVVPCSLMGFTRLHSASQRRFP